MFDWCVEKGVERRIDELDVVIVGGGLAGGLLARGFAARGGLRVAVVEAGGELGGNHTWSFHHSDVPPGGWPLMDDLIGARWNGYTVRFPGAERTLPGGYYAMASTDFAARVRRGLETAGVAMLFGTGARALSAHQVVLDDGRVLRAGLVLDTRGPARVERRLATCGFQKFAGLEVELAAPGGLRRPLLMDATVAQQGGFHFLYVLPFSDRRWLVEHTIYANDPVLDRVDLHRRVLDGIARLGVRLSAVLREEHGVLPLPWAGDEREEPDRSPLRLGYGGGWFHPVTGYSFPCAIRLAAAAAQAASIAGFLAEVRRLRREHQSQVRFGRLLNRLMFTGVTPEERWRLLARFYTLPQGTIERFYALRTTMADRVRVFAGRPPRGLSLRAVLASRRTS